MLQFKEPVAGFNLISHLLLSQYKTSVKIHYYSELFLKRRPYKKGQ